jgi:hypothetical protein
MALVQTAISTVIRPSVADSVFPAAAIWNLKPLRKEAERPARYPQAPTFSTQTEQPFQDRELTRLSESYQGQVLMALRHGLQHISALII